jgi:hypothetical protein
MERSTSRSGGLRACRPRFHPRGTSGEAAFAFNKAIADTAMATINPKHIALTDPLPALFFDYISASKNLASRLRLTCDNLQLSRRARR